MKRLLKLAIVLAIFTLTANTSFSNTGISIKANNQEKDLRGYIVKPGEIVPDFDLHLLDGTKVPIKSLRGKVVMLQFTASWCSVCIKEMPHIEKDIWLELKSNPDFALYGIDLKESAEKTAAFAKRIPITYPLTLDLDGSIFSLFTSRGAGVTRNIVIDQNGKIIFLTRLYDVKEFAQMIEVIKAELKKIK